MRLLIVTQKIDLRDDLLGFFHQWIVEFAKQCESVTVICLEKGVYELPANVRVLSLGKERCGKLKKGLALRSPDASVGAGKAEPCAEFSTASRFSNRTKYLFNFYKYIWHERGNYDTVFVHMNTEYMVLAGWLWRLMGKRVALWHAHFEVNARLLIAGLFAHAIFTTTPDGCRAWRGKVRAIGHGIDVEKFKNQKSKCKMQEKEVVRFLYAGKITPIKNPHILVEAARMLKESWSRKFFVDIVGPPTDPVYDAKLRAYIVAKGLDYVITMHGRIAYNDIPAYYCRADAVVNMCPTGAMDKTVLEGLAARTLAVVSNEAFRDLFGEYADVLIYPYQNSGVLAEKIKVLFSKSDEELARMREFLHERMKAHSSLEMRIPIIIKNLQNI